MKRHLKIIFIQIAAAAMLASVGCSNRSTPVVLQQSGTTPNTTTPNTSNTVASPLNGNLFDTSLTSDTAPAGSTTLSNNIPVNATQQSCLTSNNGLVNGTPVYPANTVGANYGVSTGNSSTLSSSIPSASGTLSATGACLDPNQQYLSANSVFSMAANSFTDMYSCYAYVAQQGAQMCTANSDPTYLFQAASMALVRCFRNVLAQQMQFTQWAPQQAQNFQATDNSLYSLLSYFSNGSGTGAVTGVGGGI